MLAIIGISRRQTPKQLERCLLGTIQTRKLCLVSSGKRYRLSYLRSHRCKINGFTKTISTSKKQVAIAAWASQNEQSENTIKIATLISGIFAASLINYYNEESKNTFCDVKLSNNVNSFCSQQPKNVMLHRRRSMKARDLEEKYSVNWDSCLGEGAYSQVFPASLKCSGEKVALKRISKKYTNETEFRRETDALLRIYDNGGHPNINGLRDMYEDKNHFYLVVDIMSGGEMFDHLIRGAYSEADASRLIQEAASALAFLHGIGVIHADLKPENILLCSKKKSDGTIQLIDFGCAVLDKDDENYKNGNLKKNNQLNFSTGTVAYFPPERFHGAPIDAASDMWSIGVILFIMLCGAHPFDLDGFSKDEEIAEQIKKNPTPPSTGVTDHLSPSAIDLIQKLMEKDPKKRLTANEMLKHPWVRGLTATSSKIIDSDKKLVRYNELRQKLEAGIFAILVANSNKDATLSEAKIKKDRRNNIMKKAFDTFDQEGKGFISSIDLSRVIRNKTGSELTSNENKEIEESLLDNNGLSLSDFSQLFSRLKTHHFPRGHVIFKSGDLGDSMYFLNAGKVEIRSKKGKLMAILRQGDFFGEGSLLDEKNVRYSTAVCASPVDVMKISKKDFNRYIESSDATKQELKVKWKARSLVYAKNLIRLQKKVKSRTFKQGDIVYKERDIGKSMYMVEEENGGTLDVTHDGVKVHSYHGGDSFGESSLLFSKPRSSTVKCVSDTCRLHEMRGSDFIAVVQSTPEATSSLMDMCRKRYFKKAIKKLNRDKNKRTFNEDDLVAAFHEADQNNRGSLDVNEIRSIMHRMDSDIPESEIVALFRFLDIDESGSISLIEFKRIFRVFEDITNE